MLINNSEFLIKESEIPSTPIKFSVDAKDWYREQKRRCVEGYWVGGKYMPPQLYFYVNFWNILLNKGKSKSKIISKPWLRDVEWEVFPAYLCARGLSGFDGALNVQDTPERMLSFLKENNKSFGCPQYDNEATDLMVMTARETGKELADYEVVMTEDGEVPICDINIGDKIAGKEGYVKVVDKFPQGVKDIYRFTFGDGRVVDCGLNHLWSVYDTSSKNTKNLTTEQILNHGLTYGVKPRFRWRVPQCEAIEYPEKELPINPYLIGLLLGDGTMTTGTIKISTDDIEIVNNIKEILPDYELHKDTSNNNYNIVYCGKDKYEKESPYGKNPLTRKIREIGLNLKCEDKYIPKEYFLSSIEQRLELIRGLMDSDGSVTTDGAVEFINKSKKLIDGLAYILRSLGINCQIALDSREGNQYHICGNKNLFTHGRYYRLYIKTGQPIFKLSRKLNRIQKRKRSNKIRIVSIEKLEQQHSCTCIMVDKDDGLFLTSNFIVTHNSFIASALVAHEWLFNGQKNYLLPNEDGFQKTMANITVGAGDSKFSSRLLVKVKMGLDILASQGIEFAGRYYPHPFFQSYSGSWSPGKQIVAKYKKKVGGTWQEVGSMSTINHVSYKDNDYAAQGSRNSLMIKEEIGMFANLEAAREADKETMMAGTSKYGTCIYIGTGGDMERGTLDAYKMFYSPAVYDIMSFEDKWEQKGKIGLFIPATMRPNEFKDSEGNTNYVIATEHFEKERELLRNSKNGSAPLNAFIQYNPIKPSEVFLRTNVNIFPVSEIKEWLADLEVKQIYQDAEMVCELIFDENGNIKPSINKNLSAIRDFPLEKEKDSNGAVVIFHHPDTSDDGMIPYGRYIAGIDPYDADKSTTSSLGSMIVMDRLSNRVVAEYSGRPKFADMFYENCRRLSIYYNAATLYENEKMGVKQYYERKNSLQYLMRQPQYIKDVIPNSTVERGFGMHMNVALKDHGEILIRDWLQEEYEVGKLSLRKIRTVPLLKEMILYDSDHGNYDRVMAFMQCMYAMQELHKQKVITAIEKTRGRDPFFDRRLNQKSYKDYRNTNQPI